MKTADQARESPPIDTDALDKIAFLQSGIPEKIVGLYFENSANLVAAMSTAAETGDSSGLGQAAHSLKSASANLGASSLANLWRELEMMSRAGDIDSTLVASVRHEHARVCTALAIEMKMKRR